MKIHMGISVEGISQTNHDKVLWECQKFQKYLENVVDGHVTCHNFEIEFNYAEDMGESDKN